MAAIGELDASDVDEFCKAVTGCGSGAGVVALDLSGVSFIGSPGISALLRCQKSLAAEGMALRLIRYSDVVERVLTAVGLLDFLTGPDELEELA